MSPKVRTMSQRSTNLFVRGLYYVRTNVLKAEAASGLVVWWCVTAEHLWLQLDLCIFEQTAGYLKAQVMRSGMPVALRRHCWDRLTFQTSG